MSFEDPMVVAVSLELLQKLLAKGNKIHVEIAEGPDPEARIIAVRHNAWNNTIELRYDRAVPDPVLIGKYE